MDKQAMQNLFWPAISERLLQMREDAMAAGDLFFMRWSAAGRWEVTSDVDSKYVGTYFMANAEGQVWMMIDVYGRDSLAMNVQGVEIIGDDDNG